MKLRSIYSLLFLFAFYFLNTAILAGQISSSESLNLPGTWDAFSNPPTVDAFRNPLQSISGNIQLITTGIPRYQSKIRVPSDVSADSYNFLFTSGPSSNYFQNKWANTTVSINSVQSYSYNCGACPDNTVTLQNNKWYTLNFQDAGYTNTQAIFMETSNKPVLINSVSFSPDIYNLEAATISIDLDTVPSPEEKIYVRYSIDGFSTSALIEVSIFGTSGQAIIPGFPGATTVEFYVFSTTISNPIADFDLVTLEWNTNGGSNYSYTVNQAFATNGLGNWSSPGVWASGFLPPSGSNVIIRNFSEISMDMDVTLSSLIIESVAELSLGTNNLSIQNNGSFNNDGIFVGNSGTVLFSGNATVNGNGTTLFNNIVISNGGVDFVNGQINGTLSIESGGYIINNPPLYATNSTLIYNTTGIYNASAEWGVPYHVRLTGGTDLILDYTGNKKITNGDVSIENNSTLLIKGPTGPKNGSAPDSLLFVKGDLNINGNAILTMADNDGDDLLNDRYYLSIKGDVNIAANAVLNLNNDIGDDLSIGGDWNNEGSFTHSGRAVEFLGTGLQQITGSTQFAFVNIHKRSFQPIWKIAGANMSISEELRLIQGEFQIYGSALRFISDSNGSASIDDFSSGFSGYITGDILVERYIDGPASGFHFVGSPVMNPNISDWASDFNLNPVNGAIDGSQIVPTSTCDPSQLEAGSPYANLFDYREGAVSSCVLEGWHTRLNGTIDIGKGFAGIIDGGTKIDVTGIMNTGNITVSGLTHINGDGYNLIANVYPSPIDFYELHQDNLLVINGTADVWVSNGFYSGTYQTISILDALPDRQIGSSQAFFVKVTAPTSGTSISFDNSDRLSGDPVFYKAKAVDHQYLNLVVSGNGFADKTRLFFKPEASALFDSLFDAEKLKGQAGQVMIYSIWNNQNLSINALPSIDTAIKIPIGFEAGNNGNFELKLTGFESFDPTSMIYVEDLLSGLMHPMNDNSSVNFQASAADQEERFMIHIFPAVQIETQEQKCQIQDAAIQLDFGNYLLNGTLQNWDYKLYDKAEKLIDSGTQLSGPKIIEPLNIGSYILELKNGLHMVTKEIVLIGDERVLANFETSGQEFQIGDTVHFNNQSTNASGYFWNFGDGHFLKNVEQAQHIFQAPGQFEVLLSASNKVCNDEFTKSITILDEVSGIENPNRHNIQISSQGNKIWVNFSNKPLSPFVLEIFDTLGRKVVLKEEVTANTKVHMRQADGYYIVRLSSESMTIVERFHIR